MSRLPVFLNITGPCSDPSTSQIGKPHGYSSEVEVSQASRVFHDSETEHFTDTAQQSPSNKYITTSTNTTFTQISDKGISFENDRFDFTEIFPPTLAPKDLLPQIEKSQPHSNSSCVTFMNPYKGGSNSILKRILLEKMEQMLDEGPVSLTAFQVNDNKHFFDLLQFDKRKGSKSFLTSTPIEPQLRKERFLSVKAAHLTINKIFQRTSIKQTRANSISSHTNLVISLYMRNNTKKVTYINLVGHEQTLAPDVFANFDLSSIVQLLTNADSGSASLSRLSGSFNDFVFRKNDRGAIKLILSLNPQGDRDLTQRVLASISQLKTNYEDSNHNSGNGDVQPLNDNDSLPGYAKPTASSSNTLQSASIPSGHAENIFRLHSLNRHSNWKDGNLSLKTSIKVPNKFKVSRASGSKQSGVSIANKLTTKVYEDQVAQLRSQITDLETHNQELKHEYHVIFERLSEQKLELNNDLIKFKNDHDSEVSDLRSKISESDIISTNSKILLQQKHRLHDRLHEFKTDFDACKSASQNLSQTILNLKLGAERLNTKNQDLLSANGSLQKELQDFRNTLEQKEIDRATFQNEYERVKQENFDFKTKLELMNQSNNEELQDIKRDLAEQQRLCHELEKAKAESIEKIRSTSSSFKKLIEENNSAINDHKAEVLTITKEKFALSGVVDENNITIGNQNEKIQSLTRENSDLASELDSRKSEHEALVKKFNDMKVSFDSETSQLKEQIAIKDELIEAKTKIIESQTQELAQKMKELEQQEQGSSEAILILQKQISTKKQELNAMKESLTLVEDERDSFIEKYEQSLDANDKLENKNKTITAKYEQMLKTGKDAAAHNSTYTKYNSREKEIDDLRARTKGKVSESRERFDKMGSTLDSYPKPSSAVNPFLDGFSSPGNFFTEKSPSDIFDSERDIFDDHTHQIKSNDVGVLTHNSLPRPLKASNTYDMLAGNNLKRKSATPIRNQKQPRLSPSI